MRYLKAIMYPFLRHTSHLKDLYFKLDMIFLTGMMGGGGGSEDQNKFLFPPPNGWTGESSSSLLQECCTQK